MMRFKDRSGGCDVGGHRARSPTGKLDHVELSWDRRIALGVVLAAHGYPMQPRKGDLITGVPNETEDSCVFPRGYDHGSRRGCAALGGRVLCVTVLADSVRQAQSRAYELTTGIQFDGMQYRSDIGLPCH